MSQAARSPEGLQQGASGISPSKLAHFVCFTDQFGEMRSWYMTVLNASPAIDQEQLCFLAYDNEHHRVGIIRSPGPMSARPPTARSVHHIAFTYESFEHLFGTYLRLRASGIEPFWCVNHGPTSSLYYRDPDGNRIELQIDNLTNAELDEFFASGAYVENPIGIIFDPDEWIGRFVAGASVKVITERPALPAGLTPFEMIRD